MLPVADSIKSVSTQQSIPLQLQSYKGLQLWELLCLVQCVIYNLCLHQYALQVLLVSNVRFYEHPVESAHCILPKPLQ